MYTDKFGTLATFSTIYIMASVTHAEFDANTEGATVTTAFADGVRGKTVLITGSNKTGLGFSAAHAIVSDHGSHGPNSRRHNLTRLGFSISGATDSRR